MYNEELYNDMVRSKMYVSSATDPETGCIEWNGCTHTNGYGRLSYKGSARWAHRVAWILENGDIPEGEGHHGTCVCHHCDNPKCINTDHMFLGSQTDNVADREAKGRGQGGPNQPNPK